MLHDNMKSKDEVINYFKDLVDEYYKTQKNTYHIIAGDFNAIVDKHLNKLHLTQHTKLRTTTEFLINSEIMIILMPLEQLTQISKHLLEWTMCITMAHISITYG
jgi:hypothetical protein